MHRATNENARTRQATGRRPPCARAPARQGRSHGARPRATGNGTAIQRTDRRLSARPTERTRRRGPPEPHHQPGVTKPSSPGREHACRRQPADRTGGSRTRVPPEPGTRRTGTKTDQLSAGPRSLFGPLLVYRPESAPKPTQSAKHDAAKKAENPKQHPTRTPAPKKPIRRRPPDRTSSEKRRRNDDQN